MAARLPMASAWRKMSMAAAAGTTTSTSSGIPGSDSRSGWQGRPSSVSVAGVHQVELGWDVVLEKVAQRPRPQLVAFQWGGPHQRDGPGPNQRGEVFVWHYVPVMVRPA